MHAFLSAASTVFGPWVVEAIVCVVLIMVVGVILQGLAGVWKFLSWKFPRKT